MFPKCVQVTICVFLVLGTLFLTSIHACSDNCTDLQEVVDSEALSFSELYSSQPVLWKQVDRFTRIYNYSFSDYEPTAAFECVLGVDINPEFSLVFYFDGNIVAYTQARYLRNTFRLQKSNNNITCQAQRSSLSTGRAYLKSIILLNYIPLLDTPTIPNVEPTWPEPNRPAEPSTSPAPRTSKSQTLIYQDLPINTTRAPLPEHFYPDKAIRVISTAHGTGATMTWIFATGSTVAAMIAIAVLLLKYRSNLQPLESNKTSEHECVMTTLNSPREIIDNNVLQRLEDPA